MFNKILAKFFYGRKKYQSFFSTLHHIGINGMNYGGSGFHVLNGEETLIKKLSTDKSFTSKKLVIVDVGAHTGSYAQLWLQHLQGKEFNIYCFEPMKDAFGILSTHFSNNANVTCINMALGKDVADRKIHVNKNHPTMTSFFEVSGVGDKNHSEYHEETISMTSLDQFSTDYEIKKIDFLKIDVEGYEYEVLTGSLNLLANSRINMIQFEFGVWNMYSKKLLKDFFDLLTPAFMIYRVLIDGLQPISYDPKLEIYNTVNFLAIRTK